MTSRQVVLEGGPPWGFRIHGGVDVKIPLKVSRVNPGSKASSRGIRESDCITSINGKNTTNLTNVEAHSLLRSSGSTLRLGLNEDTKESPNKRQYKTVHQETTQETIKRSSLKTYTLQETKDSVKNSSSKIQNYNEEEASEYSKEFQKYSETHNQKNGRVEKTPITSNSTSSSTSTPSTYKEGKHLSSPDYAIASRQSSYSNCSSFADEGKNEDPACRQTDTEDISMNNEADFLSKSKKRRLRRKNVLKGINSNLSKVEIEEITEEINENCKQNNLKCNKDETKILAQCSTAGTSEITTEIKTNETNRNIKEHLDLSSNSNLDINYVKPPKLFKTEYEVESPKELKFESIKISDKCLKAKSKSLDDEDFLKISELSENSETEDKFSGDNRAIISEASSEENLLDDISPKSNLNTLSLPLSDDSALVSLISPEEEKELRNFLGGLNLVNSPEQSAKDIYESTQPDAKARKIQRRKELEQYFLPICQNPRFLDVISEEASDISDKECSSDAHHLKQGTPDLDVDVKNDQSLKKTLAQSNVKKAPEVPTRRSRSRVLENMCNQVEQEPALLVETKLIESNDIQKTVCSTRILPKDASNVEVVFINDSSSSSNTSSGDYSDICINTENTQEKNSDTNTPGDKNSKIDMESKEVKIEKTRTEEPVKLIYNKAEQQYKTSNKNIPSCSGCLGIESLITTDVSSSLKILKNDTNIESKVSFDSTQLTPPPTPESTSPKHEEGHEGSPPKVVLFDYTKIPNILTSKESVAPYLKSVVANRADVVNKYADNEVENHTFNELTEFARVEKETITKSEEKAGKRSETVCLKPAESIKTFRESQDVSSKIQNLSKFIKTDVFNDKKYEKYVPVVNEVQDALKEREESKKLESLNKKLLQNVTKRSEVCTSSIENIVGNRNHTNNTHSKERIIVVKQEAENHSVPVVTQNKNLEVKEHIIPIIIEAKSPKITENVDLKKPNPLVIPIKREMSKSPKNQDVKPKDLSCNKVTIKPTDTNVGGYSVPIQVAAQFDDNSNEVSIKATDKNVTERVIPIHIEDQLDDHNKRLINNEESRFTASETTDKSSKECTIPIQLETKPTDTNVVNIKDEKSVSPTFSDSSASSRSSISTARYIPTASVENLTAILNEENSVPKPSFEPETLRTLVLNKLLNFPYGFQILQELAEVSKSLEDYTNKLPFRGLSGHIPAFIQKDDTNCVSNMTPCFVEKTSENVPDTYVPAFMQKIDNNRSNQSHFLVSKTPKMSENVICSKEFREHTTVEENRRLQQLQQNFYLKGNNVENKNNMFEVEGSSGTRYNEVTSPNRLLSIIREEPRSFEYQDDPNSFLFYEDNCQERLKAQNLGDWLTIARNKSKSASNLSNNEFSINNPTRNEPISNSNSVRRRSLPQDLCEKQLRLIMEKEMEIQRELEWLEDEKRKMQAELAPSNKNFKMDEFKVSKKGDFAERKEKARPISMPVIPTEFFRQQMYEEYLNELSERQERKQQKVLKISSSNDLSEIEKQRQNSKTKEIVHPIEIEEEFMSKVRAKMGNKRVGDSIEKDEVKIKENKEDDGLPVLVLDGMDVKPAETLPKHLQESLDDLTATSEDDSIWSPGQQHQRSQPVQPNLKDYQRSDSRESQNNDPTTTIWTPKSGTSSPVVERKEFRPVNFQSPVLSRRNRIISETAQTPDSTRSEPPWKLNEGQSQPDLHLPSRDFNLSASLDRRLPTSQSTPGFGSLGPSPRLPRAQNPTITLLQKAREGQLPKGAHYLEPQRPDPLERKVVPKPRVPVKLSGDYHIKSDYESDYDSERPRSKMADYGPRKFEGVGPTTKDGMPIILRSEIKEKDQSKWYKNMYDTIHKQKPARDEYLTIRYRQKRAQYPYSSGYLSEPEPGSYDSDFSEYKYQTLDRRRGPHAQYYYDTSTMPRNNYVPDKSYSSSDIVKNTLVDKYDNKPGRIENYTPGKSSISEKEAKRWWDEVMDIFDGHLEQQKRMPSFSQPQNPRSFINQALKESGYESDSTLVFRRKEDTANLISPKEQKEVYKNIQKGGDVPFKGLRKLAPEKPKEMDLVEFFKLSPTLTKIRIHKNITPQNEFFVYPATVHHYSPPTFASLKRTAPSSVTVPKGDTPPLERVPSPPKRRSSRNNSTLRLISTMKVKTDKSTSYKRHETCFSPGPSVDKSKVNYLRDKITCKLSPFTKRKSDSPKISVTKKIIASPELKSRITSTVTTSRDPKSSVRKVQSSTKISGHSKNQETSSKLYKSSSTSTLSKRSSTDSLSSRTSTPVKTFGTEKRKFDFTNSKLKLAKTGSAEELVSPTEVQKVLHTPSYKRSTVHLSRNDLLPIKVGINPKAKDILRSTIKRPLSLSPKVARRALENQSFSKKSSVESLRSLKSTNKTVKNDSGTLKSKSKSEDTKNSKTKANSDNIIAKKNTNTLKCLSKASGLDMVKKLEQNELSKQKEAMETNYFFRHLFLRNFEPNATFSYPRSSLILEKTKMLARRRYSIPEPTIGAMKIYLKHTKPVSDSKFISLDIVRSRSTSPKSVTFSDSVGDMRNVGKRSKSLPSKIVFSQTSRPVSPVVTKKLISPILKTSNSSKDRSPSPPAKIVFTQTCRQLSPVVARPRRPLSPLITHKLRTGLTKENVLPNLRSPSPQTKLFFSETSRPVSPEVRRKVSQSPTLGRSPSSRKIMQFKQQNEDRRNHELKIYTCPNLNHSTTSLDSFRSEDYFRELSFSKPTEKFKDLNHFYSDIAKVGELEKTFDLKPRKKCEGDIIDFERWQEVRLREKAEYELKHLYSHLKENEKEKGFLFRPKDVEKYKWKKEYDRGLRNREKSVENIKFEFERLKKEESERENAKRREMAYSKDTYKPLWRGNSVLSLASILTERRSRSEDRVRNIKQKLLMDDEKLLSHGIGSRIWSSLSMEQVSNLKEQLQEIYGDETAQKKPKESKLLTKYVNNNASNYAVDVPKSRVTQYVPKLTIRRNSESAKPDPMTEDEKKMISYTLSKEVLEQISKKRKEDKLALPLVMGKETLGATAAKDANVKVLTKKEEPVTPLVKTDALKIPSASETESASTDDSTKTTINAKDVQKKVEYFEKAQELDLYVPTVHQPAEEGSISTSSGDLSPKSGKIVNSNSCQDFKEFFGESELVKFATLPLSATRKSNISYKKKPELRALDMSPIRTISESNSFDSLLRSRSVSPYSEEAQSLSKKGEVERLKRQFEILEDFFGEESLKRSKSENDLGNCGQVEDLRRKYEYPVHSGRGRSRARRAGVVSPVYLRAEDRYMPHINIISKIATLYSASKKFGKKDSVKNMQQLADILGCPIGEVEKMKEKFDRLKECEETENVSLLGRMYTSSPSLKELRDITPYLTANWIAHRFPKSEDNTRSLSSPETSVGSWDTSIVKRDRARGKSSSPTKKQVQQSILKKDEATKKKKDGKDGKNKDASRYTKDHPVSPDLSPATNLAAPPARVQSHALGAGVPPPPPPPPKSHHLEGIVRSLSQESPRKYVENQVNIHYKTPVRQEIKEYVSEEELAHRQAEQMKKIYEEDRRRKYLQQTHSHQELQDMKSRRHTDNFIPSQKSPISLNRYDDFEDLTPTTKTRPRSPEPRLVARALYNFVGQTSRELTFRKGDLIYVRKQIDKNWYEGELNAMVGLFPTNYVEIVPYEGIRTAPRKAHEGQARAKYNFVAQTHLELSLAKGELVTVTRRVDDNWFEGKIGGRKGIFPVSYVEILIDPSQPPPPSTKPVASPAAHSILLNGSSQGKESMGSHQYAPIPTTPQPPSYHAKPVQLSGTGTYSTLPKPSSKSPISEELRIETQSEPVAYRALYKYTPQNDDELELFENDLIYVLEKCDDGWFVGSSERTGAFGTFPGNYVEKVSS